LGHAYAQCRSNKGAPGVDGQEFADIEAYGVQRWLGELALALRQETYRPDPIRRVFIPKANGKLRPLGISTLRDRVCMTAAMLVQRRANPARQGLHFTSLANVQEDGTILKDGPLIPPKNCLST
jgi:retron-type reverse transcriptase